MNRDPFDTLRSRNPAPRESLPEAPMAVASQITAERPTLRRGLAIAAATAAVVLVAGGGWLIWSRGGGGGEVVGPTTVLVPETTATSLPPAQEEVPELVVYFLKDGTLMPVARDLRVLNVRPLPDLGPLAIDLLLWGPGAWDAGPLPDPVAAAEAQLTTAIPEGTRLLSLDVAGGIAAIDLSAEFASTPAEGVAQVLFTLTRLPGVTGVSFLVEGVPHSAVAGMMTLVPTASPPAGAILEDPATRLTFEGIMPLALLESPALGGTLRVPGTITGVANPYEWRVGLTLADAEGTVLWETVVEATCGTPWQECRGEYDWSLFTGRVPAGLVDYGQWGTLTAFVFSGDDPPQPYAFRSQPVWLELTVPFTDEPDVPEATTTTFGLGEMRPLPEGTLTGCAAETARDIAAFEAALADGPISLEGLCALVGAPDGEVGSGLFIPVYDLSDGSRLFLGYTAPWGDGLLYANLVSPDGTVRHLLDR